MSRVSRAFRITGALLKFFFFGVVAFVIGLLLWRVLSAGDPKSMETLTPNADLLSAYEQQGEDLYMFRQDLDTITRAERNAGYFAITNYVLIPSANQIQIVFRYNNSTIRYLAQDYSLDEIPSREEELFDVSLVLSTDKTPDNPDDNASNKPESVQLTRLHPVSVTSDTKNVYNYRRLVFDLNEADLSLSELLDSNLLLAVYTDIYYNQAVDYEELSYGTIILYDYSRAKKTVELEKEDIRALKQFAN